MQAKESSSILSTLRHTKTKKSMAWEMLNTQPFSKTSRVWRRNIPSHRRLQLGWSLQKRYLIAAASKRWLLKSLNHQVQVKAQRSYPSAACNRLTVSGPCCNHVDKTRYGTVTSRQIASKRWLCHNRTLYQASTASKNIDQLPLIDAHRKAQMPHLYFKDRTSREKGRPRGHKKIKLLIIMPIR